MTAKYHAALYMRLSKDDDRVLESASISTQRKMLQTYAREQGFEVYGEYVDDGYSGTNFNRPAWERLLKDIEAKHVNLVITKDLSRLGRDYIMTGQFTELYFPSKKVRFVAINDGYDSDSPLNDIAPFKNMVNEMYARDTSKKIRSAFQTKIKEGAFIGNFAPYGYEKDPKDKNHLVIDPVTAPIVHEIFDRAEHGEAPFTIAKRLNERNVETPYQYRCMTHPYLIKEESKKVPKWTSGTICKMLSNEVYLGHVVQGKTVKLSFKSDITLSQPRKEWVVVKDKHEPIVTQEVFDRVRNRSVPRKKTKNIEFHNIFSGLAVCGDCKRNMSIAGKTGDPKAFHLVCSGYKQYGNKVCSSHKISYELLYQIVSEEIKNQLDQTEQWQKELLETSKKASSTSRKKEPVHALDVLKKRDKEIFRIIGQLYEDKVNQRISEERFYDMLSSLEREQKGIDHKLKKAQQEVLLHNNQSQVEKNDEELDQLIKEILGEIDMTPELVLTLIEKIEIGSKNQEESQSVKIYFHSKDPSNKEPEA
jgi:DNA invertase Pin-like site-specific DNA recombinase